MCCKTKQLVTFVVAILTFSISVGLTKSLEDFLPVREDSSATGVTELPLNPRVENPSRFLTDKTDPCEEIKGIQGYGGKANNKTDIILGVVNNRACFVAPIYPKEAIANNITGQVNIEVRVDGFGKVTSAKVIEGNELFKQAAIEAAYKTKFIPTWLRGEPVNVRGILVYNFTLTK